MMHFTADTHFYHGNILKLSNRPFTSVEEMYHSLIANWNAVVGKLVLFHYPILEWQFYHRKSAHLYGHVHNNESHVEGRRLAMDERAFNVGVDANHYFPVSAESIYAKAFGRWPTNTS